VYVVVLVVAAIRQQQFLLYGCVGVHARMMILCILYISSSTV
jgi:hypothetical protein